MSIQFPCEYCRVTLRVPDDAVGREAKCPSCGQLSHVDELYASFSDASPTGNPFADSYVDERDEYVRAHPASVIDDGRTNSSETAWACAAHWSSLAGFLLPFGNIFGPLVVWLSKRDKMPFVDDQAKQSLNFQITVTLCGVLFFFAGFLTCGITWLLLIPLSIANVVFPILAAIRANDGERYLYPFSIAFFR